MRVSPLWLTQLIGGLCSARAVAMALMVALAVAVVPATASPPRVLMFVAQEDVYYSEYIVIKRALESSGYQVDVRSSSNAAASVSTYLVPAGSTVVEQANSLAGGSYAGFTAQFQNRFGSAWLAADDVVPGAGIPVMGRIQDVLDLGAHEALIMVGGTGALAYRVDGSYAPLGVASAAEVEDAAVALNRLALDALSRGKPVMAQCHGASLAAFFRIPNTSGPGAEALGYSLLKGSHATGFPEPDTGVVLASLDVNHRPGDTLTIASPHSELYLQGTPQGHADARIITTRDWYPQNVAHAAGTVLNILRTYPAPDVQQAPLNVLLLHGGAVDINNCGPGNRLNDIPCNFGTGANTPADYLDILAALSIPALADEDGIEMQVESVHLTPPSGVLPFDPNDETSVRNYLDAFDSVLLFKHWSTGMPDPLQAALVDFVDDGGGMLALHHALYNDVDGPLDKDILVDSLFQVHSPMATWSGSSLQHQDLLFTQAGHFISSFHLAHRLPTSVAAPAAWSTYPLPTGANPSGQSYQRITVFDEIYNNWTVLPGAVFGSGIGDIEPLLSTTGTPQSSTHLAGFSKRVDPSADGTVGRVVFMMPGERKESFAPASVYPRLVRNALLWTAKPANPSGPGPDALFGDSFESL